MDHVGASQLLLIGLAILVALGAIIFVRRTRIAKWAHQADDLTRARLRRVYWAFLFMAGFVAAMLAAVTVPRPPAEMQAAVTLVGIYGVLPLLIAVVVAATHAVVLWRQVSVWILWALLVLFGSVIAFLIEAVSDLWVGALLFAYALSTSTLAIRGLVAVRPGRPGWN